MDRMMVSVVMPPVQAQSHSGPVLVAPPPQRVFAHLKLTVGMDRRKQLLVKLVMMEIQCQETDAPPPALLNLSMSAQGEKEIRVFAFPFVGMGLLLEQKSAIMV